MTIEPRYTFARIIESEYFSASMKDTPTLTESDSLKLQRAGAERMMIGCQMFDEFRAEIIASLPKDLSKEEFGKQLFERIYGASMEDFLSGRITDAHLDR